jgi:hypothetical protein
LVSNHHTTWCNNSENYLPNFVKIHWIFSTLDKTDWMICFPHDSLILIFHAKIA